MYHFEIFIRAYNRITVTQHEKLKKNRSLVSKTRSDRWKKFQDSPPSTIKIRSKLVRRNRCSHRSKLPSSKDRDRGDLSLSAHPRRPHPSRKERFRAGIVSERRIGDKRIWTARDTETHVGKKIGRGDGGGEVELRGQTKKRNRVTTIIAVPGRKVRTPTLSSVQWPADKNAASVGAARWKRGDEDRGGQGKVTEGVLKVFAEQIRGRQLGLFGHGAARVPLFVRLNKILLRAACTRDETRARISSPTAFWYRFWKQIREACYDAHDPRKLYTDDDVVAHRDFILDYFYERVCVCVCVCGFCD